MSKYIVVVVHQCQNYIKLKTDYQVNNKKVKN